MSPVSTVANHLATSSTMQTTLVRDAESFGKLANEWEELLADSSYRSLALTHGWLKTWWDVFKSGRDLCILLVRDHEHRLVGAMPLLRRTVWHRRLVPLKRLEFLATGEDEVDEIDSDYLDVILRRGHEVDAFRAALSYLLNDCPLEWDELVLANMDATSPNVPLWQSVGESLGLEFAELKRQDGVIIHLPKTWDEYIAGVGKKFRYNLKHSMNVLFAAGDVQLRVASNADEFREIWPTLVELHQMRWQAAGQPGCFSSPLFCRFHEEIGPRLADEGKAWLSDLRVDGRPVSVRYLFAYNRTVSAYQGGRDLSFLPRASVSDVHLAMLIQEAMKRGFRYCDFLKSVAAHKLAWSRDLNQQVTIRLSRRTLRCSLRTGIEWGVRRLRRLRPSSAT